MKGRPETLFYLKPSCIEIYFDSGKEKITVEFKNDEVRHLDLLNKEKFAATIIHALGERKATKSVLILSSDVVFFAKRMLSEDLTDFDDDFLKNVPFAKNNVLRVRYADKESVTWFGANRDLTEWLVKILNEKGWKVALVVPQVVIPELKDGVLNTENVASVIYSSQDQKDVNMIGDTNKVESIPKQPIKTEGEEQKERPSIKPIWIGVVVFILFLIGASVVLYRQYQSAKTKDSAAGENKVSANVTIASTPTAEPTPVSTPSSVFKKNSELKINILNGSGKPGQAGKVRDLVQQFGVVNVEVGNWTGEKVTDTVVEKHEGVSPDDWLPVSLALNKMFVKVTEKEASGSSAFDVLIITGEEK